MTGLSGLVSFRWRVSLDRLSFRMPSSTEHRSSVSGVPSPSPAGPILYASQVAAGFPSPADDYIEKTIDLNAELVKNPPATFFVRVAGDSMVDTRIHDGDVLIVDRSVPPAEGRIVVAAINGELTVKRLVRKEGQLVLAPANPAFPDIIPAPDSEVSVWGVVVYVIHRV